MGKGKLKACPFCGKDDPWTGTTVCSNFPFGMEYVQCEKCFAMILRRKKETAIRAWNRRKEVKDA